METLSPKQLARLRKMKTRIEREGKGFKQYLESMGFEDENIKNIMAIAEIEIPPEESESSTRSDSEVIVKQREIYYEYDDKNQNRVLSLPKPKTHEEWVEWTGNYNDACSKDLQNQMCYCCGYVEATLFSSA